MFRFSETLRIWSFHVVVLQRTANKCTKVSTAHAELLFSSLNLLFNDVPVAVAVVVCLRSLFEKQNVWDNATPRSEGFEVCRLCKQENPFKIEALQASDLHSSITWILRDLSQNLHKSELNLDLLPSRLSQIRILFHETFPFNLACSSYLR